MGHILDYDGKFINFLNKATDTLIATLLWLVCSIPIITIGASTTAFYSVMLKLVKDEESYITKSFFKAFKENFWLILGVIGAVLLTSIYIVLNTKTIGGVFQYALPLYVIIFLFYYIFHYPFYCFRFYFKSTSSSAILSPAPFLLVTDIWIVLSPL